MLCKNCKYFKEDRNLLHANGEHGNEGMCLTPLYTSPSNSDQTAKIKELEAERDMIFGLLKQLRVTFFNMCNEEKSDLEWIYETNMVMKEIDFMFLHGYLQDSKTELAELNAKLSMLQESHENWRDGYIREHTNNIELEMIIQDLTTANKRLEQALDAYIKEV